MSCFVGRARYFFVGLCVCVGGEDGVCMYEKKRREKREKKKPGQETEETDAVFKGQANPRRSDSGNTRDVARQGGLELRSASPMTTHRPRNGCTHLHPLPTDATHVKDTHPVPAQPRLRSWTHRWLAILSQTVPCPVTKSSQLTVSIHLATPGLFSKQILFTYSMIPLRLNTASPGSG